MKSKKIRTIIAIISFIPALIVGASGLFSAFLLFLFPSIMNFLAAIFWTSLAVSYFFFAKDTYHLNKK
jgi:hypothetical protein